MTPNTTAIRGRESGAERSAATLPNGPLHGLGWAACPSAGREDLSTPRIVQRDQPATIPLTTQDVGRFATHYDCIARGIGAAKTPPADVKRHILSFDQLLGLRAQNSPECDKPGERFPELSGPSDKLAGSG